MSASTASMNPPRPSRPRIGTPRRKAPSPMLGGWSKTSGRSPADMNRSFCTPTATTGRSSFGAKRAATRAKWFWTEHQISEARRFNALRKLGRCVGQQRGRFPTRVFGVSEAGAARLKQQFGASTVQCIRTGIHVQDPVPWDGSNAAAIPRGAFAGRLIAGKGIWPLLNAMVLLKEKGSDIHLTLVGRGMTDEVNAYIRDNNLSNHVTLAGHQLDVEPYYREADFVIIPTLVREALGMVSLEARRYALPVIYSNRGGLPETQIDGLTGLMLPSPTAEEIARAILSLQSDPARYARMRQRASRAR